MDVGKVVEYYTALLARHEWLTRGGLGWSVIHRLGGSRAGERAAVEVFGSFPEFREVDVRESYLYPTVELFVDEHMEDGVLSVLDRDGFHQNRPEWLRWLSRDARLWHVSWGVRGHEKLIYAENGRLLVHYPDFCTDEAEIYGDDPTALGDRLSILTGAPGNGRQVKRAAAMALVEVAGGVRLHEDVLFGRQRALLADRLVEDDPEQAFSLPHVDPELHLRLTAASQEQRRRMCELVVDRLAQRHFPKWPEPMRAVDAALAHDAGTVTALMSGIVETNIRLGREWFERPVDGPREENRLWMRWQAGISARLVIRTLVEGGDGSEALIAARKALGKGWPELRRQILSKILTG
ncbi:hypothetical protein [Sinosporangium siamense]|uniref:Uncharacterized protein n=1 Tax=Sinosporangium siamense TaxID=1367973 RepID=A0A919RH46_9ACTN|nr:hypothetical protein [Sinosporangium siamense]GII91749.1 hypothetical protein Ssi02_19800 [Sinosporangium siamense]